MMNDVKGYRVFLKDHEYRRLQDLRAWIKGFESSGKIVDGKYAFEVLMEGLKEVRDK